MAEDDPFPEADGIPGLPHPRTATSLFGQDAAVRTFLDALQTGRLHHGWMLTGPRGVGKATLAWAMARTVLAEERDGLLWDPSHPISRRTAALAEPRLALCRRPYDTDRKRLKATITVDEVRKLKQFFELSAADGGWRVAIVDAADDLNPNAANALLKLLEEPPEDALLILIAHQPARLLPTIRSRCRTLPLSPLNPDDLARALTRAGLVPPDPTAIYALSDGAPGIAAQLLAGGGDALYRSILGLLATLPRLDRTALQALAADAAQRGQEPRYALMLDLIDRALARLALSGAHNAALPEAAPGEADIHARLAPSPAAARAWADLAETLGGRTRHATAVNLDPSSVILDTFLKIEATAQTITR